MDNNITAKQNYEFIKVNKFPKIISLILAIGMILIISLSIRIGIFLEEYSHFEAHYNPEIAHMRIPVLIITESIVVLFILAAILSLFLILNFIKDNFFSKNSVILLTVMSICFLIMMILGIVLIIYTMLNIKGSITNFWLLLGVGISFIVTCVFALAANLINQARKYKDENELTV